MVSRQALIASLSLLVVGCPKPDEGPSAEAELAPIGASNVEGNAEFKSIGSGRVRIELDVTGLTPGPHGVHVHEYGDCSSADGLAAGEHFNPDGSKHGAPNATMHHAGDFGNIVANNDGRATLSLETDSITLDTGRYGVLGRSLIVHAQADDLTSQPSGNSGARVACGVIRATTGRTTPVLPSQQQ